MSIKKKSITNRHCTTDCTIMQALPSYPLLLWRCSFTTYRYSISHHILLCQYLQQGSCIHELQNKSYINLYWKSTETNFLPKELPLYSTKHGDKELSAYKSTKWKAGQLVLYTVCKSKSLFPLESRSTGLRCTTKINNTYCSAISKNYALICAHDVGHQN